MQSDLLNAPKVVVIGSCSVDFTTYAPRLPKPGETLIGTKFTTSYGGKGANQCVAAAKLGLKPYMICRLGNDQWGEKYKENLKQVGVNVDHVYCTPDISTGIAQISVADNGENQIVIVPGSNGHLSVQDVDQSAELIKRANVLIGQLETPFETTLEAFKLNHGIKLLNAAPARKDIDKILPYCTILCVNESEASILTDINVTLSNAVTALKKLLNTGCETVIITLGPDGAVYLSKDDNEPIHVLCDPVKAVDATEEEERVNRITCGSLMMHRRRLRDANNPLEVSEERFTALFRISKEIALALIQAIESDVRRTRAYGLPVHVIGAGDAFVGALATFLVSGKNFPLHQIVGAACRVATISVTKEGTQNSYPTDCNLFDKTYKYLKL